MIDRVMNGEVFLGSRFETASAVFFFGSAALKREQLADKFLTHKFCFLKQIHSARVVPAEPGQNQEADGHFSDKRDLALAIQTADCVPLMLANDSQVCALHAGWRGTAAGIVGTSKTAFVEPPTVAVIGPHIHCESFEIGQDVAKTLLAEVPSSSDRAQFTEHHPDPAKCYFNLAALLKFQLLKHFPEIQIFEVNENTFTSSNYHSFRRDKNALSMAQGARQFSFVMLKP